MKLSEKLAVAFILAGALLSLTAIAMHPQAGPSSPDLLKRMVELASMDMAVHTVLTVVVLAQVFAYIVLAQRLGMDRPAALGGLIAYVFGAAATIGAMMLDGYFTPMLAAHYANGSPSDVQTALGLLTATAIAIQVATRVGINATLVAFACWSIAFMHERVTRIAGVVGLVSTLGSLALVATIGRFDPHNLLAVTFTEVLWSLGAAWSLYNYAGSAAMVAGAPGVRGDRNRKTSGVKTSVTAPRT